MRSLVAVILLLLLSPSAKELKTSLPTSSLFGRAHICPVAPNYAFTARHVAVWTNVINREERPIPNRWWDGVLTTLMTSPYADIAIMQSDKVFPYTFNMSEKPLKLGDTVYVTGYNADYVSYNIKAKVIAFGPGIVYLDKTPGPGSSGSCVFNTDGEAVGINFAFIDDYRRPSIAVLFEESDRLAIKELLKRAGESK